MQKLNKNDLVEVAKDYPLESRIIRRAAVRMAILRGIKLLAKAKMESARITAFISTQDPIMPRMEVLTDSSADKSLFTCEKVNANSEFNQHAIFRHGHAFLKHSHLVQIENLI